jgi:DnaJ-domain-containing protein 1
MLPALLSAVALLPRKPPPSYRAGAWRCASPLLVAHSEDSHSILGVEPGATPAAIKRAYRRLALRNHPDTNKAADAEASFQRIAEAYALLSATASGGTAVNAHGDKQRSGANNAAERAWRAQAWQAEEAYEREQAFRTQAAKRQQSFREQVAQRERAWQAGFGEEKPRDVAEEIREEAIWEQAAWERRYREQGGLDDAAFEAMASTYVVGLVFFFAAFFTLLFAYDGAGRPALTDLASDLLGPALDAHGL